MVALTEAPIKNIFAKHKHQSNIWSLNTSLNQKHGGYTQAPIKSMITKHKPLIKNINEFDKSKTQ